MRTDKQSADSGKKDTMSLTLALTVFERLNKPERFTEALFEAARKNGKSTRFDDVARDNLAEAVRVVSAAAKYRIPQKPEKSKNYWAKHLDICPTCGFSFFNEAPQFCNNCGQALDWSGRE